MKRVKHAERDWEGSVYQNPRNLPVLYEVDVAVVGGSFAGVSAAKEFAENGKTVALIESRTYLGREVTSVLRPWLEVPDEKPLNPFPAVIRRIAGAEKTEDGEIPLYMDQVKRDLEDLLLKEEVNLLYASYPTGIYGEEDGGKLLVIGNKSGRQVIKAKTIIDATETASVLRLAGEEFAVAHPVRRFRKTIEMYRTDELNELKLKVPEEIGIENNTVQVHKGYLERGHVFLDFKLTMEKKSELALHEMMEYEVASRHVMMKLAEYLIQHHPSFRNAYLAASSYELQALDGPRLNRVLPGGTSKLLDDVMQAAESQDNSLPFSLAEFASSDNRIWCLNETAPVEQNDQLFRNPVSASMAGEKVARWLMAGWDEILSLSASASATGAEEPDKEPDRVKGTIAELDQPQPGKNYERQPVPGENIPVLHYTDVLVVGGGTSGATAAITSAREGVETMLLEMNPGLGGTATLGAVDSYWFGRRLGFNARVTEMVNEVQERINHHSPKWNIEAKMYALLNEAEKAGVTTCFYTTTIGTIMEGNRVKGVIVASKWGTFAVIAETVIDATGDGDVAAFAGAEYVYGSQRDHIVMWYSLAQFAKPGRSQNNFTSMVHISNVVDYTRAILEGRRRKRKRDVHDHGIYVASRETRHVLGEEVMTLTDQLKHRQWDDVVNIHFSNHDLKGKNGADWMHLGLIPPNLEIEIPYRVLLPAGLEGILIAGKAISVTHDAFAAIRMQSDLENLGGVVALAAVQAVREHQLPRNIDVRQLQARVVKEGLLPANVLSRKVQNREYDDEELAALVESLTGEQPLYMYADMEMDEVFTERIPIVEVCTAGPRVVPYLRDALDKASETGDTGREVVLAQALAMYESSYGVPVLLREIEKDLAGGELPARDNIIRHTQLPPDQGAMPDVVYLIYSLGMTRDKRALDIWDRVADMINPTEENLKDMYKGTFYYVDAVCYGAERLGDAACIPILEKFYRHPNLSGQVRTSGVEPDYFKERQAMLDLAIARALARCGSKKGFRVLIDYLDDTRSLLAEQAHAELRQISKKDYRKSKEKWLDYLNEQQGELQPQPVTMKLDMPVS